MGASGLSSLNYNFQKDRDDDVLSSRANTGGVVKVVMVGGLGSWDCTCSFILALVCCVSGCPPLRRLFIDQQKAQQRLEV